MIRISILLLIFTGLVYGAVKVRIGYETLGSGTAVFDAHPPEGWTSVNSYGGIQSSQAHSGGFSAQYNGNADNNISNRFDNNFMTGVFTTSGRCYMTGWIRVSSASWNAPLKTIHIFSMGDNATDGVQLLLTNTGKIGVGTFSGTWIVSDSTPIVFDAWMLMTMYTNWGASVGADTDLFTYNGHTMTQHKAHSISSATGIAVGYLQYPGNLIGQPTGFLLDDIKLNDASGSNENSWPDTTSSSIMVVSIARADTAIGGWLGALGGNTNLFNAIKNIPPKGLDTASESNTTQIVNSVSSATDNYKAACQSYDVAGVPSNLTIRNVWALARSGEHVLGVKTIGVSLQGNPTDASENTGTVGGDLHFHRVDGNLGIPNSTIQGWVTLIGPFNTLPTVTRNLPIVAQVGKRTATTNKIDIDQLLVYIEAGANPNGVTQGRKKHIN